MGPLQIQRWLDGLAISGSALCLVHCLATPVLLLASAPLLAAAMPDAELFHVGVLAVMAPVSVAALFLGCRRHQDRTVFVLGALGLLVLVLAAWLGHDGLGELGEPAATVFGGLLLAAGHLRNYRSCRRAGCEA